MTSIVFSHANSFPAATYKVLFKSLRARGFSVKAIDKFGHDPRFPVSNNWPYVVQQLVEFTTKVAERSGGPVWLVGHSLGGFLSLMAAAQHPELARGVVLVDSPLVGGWKSKMVGLAKSTQLVGSISPGAVSRKRRNHWPDADAALEHFRHKKPLPSGTRRCCRTMLTTFRWMPRAGASWPLTAKWKPLSTTPCPITWTSCSHATRSNARSPSLGVTSRQR